MKKTILAVSASVAISLSAGVFAGTTATLDEIKSAPPVTLSGTAQFRWGQVMGWCVSTPECKAKLRAELEKHEGPWAEDSDAMLKMLDDPNMTDAQQRIWTRAR